MLGIGASSSASRATVEHVLRPWSRLGLMVKNAVESGPAFGVIVRAVGSRSWIASAHSLRDRSQWNRQIYFAEQAALGDQAVHARGQQNNHAVVSAAQEMNSL